jgi:hypothetical protein
LSFHENPVGEYIDPILEYFATIGIVATLILLVMFLIGLYVLWRRFTE